MTLKSRSDFSEADGQQINLMDRSGEHPKTRELAGTIHH
jgi:hypothetical protein